MACVFTVNVFGEVLCSCLCGMCTVCVWCVDGVVCSGEANDERNREHVVLNLLSNF